MKIIPRELVTQLTTNNSDIDYDTQLWELGKKYKEFYVVNPAWPEYYINYIDKTAHSEQCIVWIHNHDWVVKKFNKQWNSSKGWKTIDIKLDQTWVSNKTIKGHFKFFESPENSYRIKPWDEECIHIWYIDSSFIGSTEKVWAFETFIGDRKDISQIKDMGYVMPFIDRHIVKHNPDLPMVFNDTNYQIPYSDTKYEHIWHLDPQYYSYLGIESTDKIWVESRCATTMPVGIKDMGYIQPFIPRHAVKYNTELPPIFNETNYQIPYSDLQYEHIWYLDPQYYSYLGIESTDKIWVESRCATDNPIGIKDMGVLKPYMPKTIVTENNGLPKYDFGIDYQIPYSDLQYEHIWYLDPVHNRYFNITTDDKIWVESRKTVAKPIGIKDMGYVKVSQIEKLDVIFISYNELDAEKNWNRVLEKAPHAKRVNGVKGIFNAHKAAAEIATTDIFFVVDADAYLVDEWNFDFIPTHWGMVAVHVFKSINPINGLEYGYGAVKMFPRKILLDATKWNIDVSTSVTHNVRVIDKISNYTNFNTDPFSTWCAAFRECTKLSSKIIGNQQSDETDDRLLTWSTIGKDKPFGEYSINGALAGTEYGKTHSGNLLELKKINDRIWLQEQFENRI